MVMKFPQLPTDNLYKFMALSGITIFIFSMVPFFHSHQLMVKAIRLSGEIKKLNAQVEWLSTDVKKLANETDRMKKQVDKLEEVTSSEITLGFDTNRPLSEVRKEKEKELEKISREVDKLEAKLSEKLEMQRKQKIDSIQLATKNSEHKYLVRVIGIEFILGVLGALGGLLLAEKGFKYWYNRLQVPQDMIIQKKEESKSKDV